TPVRCPPQRLELPRVRNAHPRMVAPHTGVGAGLRARKWPARRAPKRAKPHAARTAFPPGRCPGSGFVVRFDLPTVAGAAPEWRNAVLQDRVRSPRSGRIAETVLAP